MRLQLISISLVLKCVDLFSFSRTNLRTKTLYWLNWFEDWDYIGFVAIGLRYVPMSRFFYLSSPARGELGATRLRDGYDREIGVIV